MSANTGYVSKMPLYFTDEIILGKDQATRYRNALINAPWGVVNQRVREDRILDKKGAQVFPPKEIAAQ